MSENDERYTYRITWSEADREHVGLCLELPSLSWLAKTPEAALRGIRKLVAECVAEMRKNGGEPPPSLADRSFSGRFVVRVPPHVHRDLVLKAAEEGVSLNRLVSAKLSAD